MDYKNHIQKQLMFLYGDKSEQVWQELNQIIDEFRARNYRLPAEKFQLTEKDAILITYGDQFQSSNQNHLKSLTDFLKRHLGGAVNWVHLLPFYPYSSDDGFSVIDFRLVNPSLGTWDDIHNLSESYLLMFDAVINHISRKSDWFQSYKAGDSPYTDYFISVDPSTDLSSIFRPRALPLLHPVETPAGKKYVWTTFSEDQIDLNFSNPQVLLEIIKLLLFYLENGASLIRLDAVGYVWKQVGTSSINLPQAHSVVKIFRSVLNIAAPNTGIVTETNVPHIENIRYFGESTEATEPESKPSSGDEAQMVYNFSLAPLILHTFYAEDASVLAQWVKTLRTPFQDSTFFNFIASHDGIGVMPAKGLLTDEQVQALVDRTILHGGEASYKTNSDGTKSVYELNITLFDALNNPKEENSSIDVPRFLASQAIMLSIAGVPGIYIHSLFGSNNCYSCKQETGRARSLNREKFDLDIFESHLEKQEYVHTRILNEYRRLLLLRQAQPAFHPAAAQEVLENNKHVFVLLRTSLDEQSRILCLINVSSHDQNVDIDLSGSRLPNLDEFLDLISGQTIASNNGRLELTLEAFQIQWLRTEKPI
jgi:sucrose phosphorylase